MRDAFKSSPGANVIPFKVKSNSDSLFHIDVSVTRGMEVIHESSALTDKTVSDEELLAVLLGLSLACALDSRSVDCVIIVHQARS